MNKLGTKGSSGFIDRIKVRVRSRFRKVITGDEKKRIRDLINEKENEPIYVKLFDKIGFTLGVLNISVCQFFLLNYPRYFWLWYSMVMPSTLITRIYHYESLGWQYFLIDFCYFVIFLSFIDLYIIETPILSWILSLFGFPFQSSESLIDTNSSSSNLSGIVFKVMFILTTGPLPIAIPLWRNSFVFHDYDKITSVFIHILPEMLYYSARWYGHECVHRFSSISLSKPFNTSEDALIQICLSKNEKFFVPLLHFSDFVYATIVYIFWQICYFIKTEVLDKKKLDQRPELLTSLRWLSTDTKNPIARLVLKLLKLIRIFRPDEEYDSTTVKTKIVFMMSQLVYTTITFIITPFLYHSHLAHLCHIIFIFIVAVYNGASFYIDIFSSRYQRQLDSLKKYVKDSE